MSSVYYTQQWCPGPPPPPSFAASILGQPLGAPQHLAHGYQAVAPHMSPPWYSSVPPSPNPSSAASFPAALIATPWFSSPAGLMELTPQFWCSFSCISVKTGLVYGHRRYITHDCRRRYIFWRLNLIYALILLIMLALMMVRPYLLLTLVIPPYPIHHITYKTHSSLPNISKILSPFANLLVITDQFSFPVKDLKTNIVSRNLISRHRVKFNSLVKLNLIFRNLIWPVSLV